MERQHTYAEKARSVWNSHKNSNTPVAKCGILPCVLAALVTMGEGAAGD
jgi:hypothetical protein